MKTIDFIQFIQQHNSDIPPIVLAHGDDYFQADQVKKHYISIANEHSCCEIIRFDIIRNGDDLAHLNTTAHTASLFGDNKLIVINNPQACYDDKVKKSLTFFKENQTSNCHMLLLSGKIKAQQLKAKWLTHIMQDGVIINLKPLKNHECLQWLQQQFNNNRLKADRSTYNLLIELSGSDLNTLDQTIQKLKLHQAEATDQETHIDQQLALQALTSAAHGSIFNLVDAILASEINKSFELLQNIRSQGIETTLVLWALCRELRSLYQMQWNIKQGQSLTQVTASQWSSRKDIIKKSLKRLCLEDLSYLLQFAMQVDNSIKGVNKIEPWHNMEHLIAMFNGSIAINWVV